MASESVSLESTTSLSISDNDLNEHENSNSNCYLPNTTVLTLHQIPSLRPKVEDGEEVVLDGPDQMMNPGANTPMSNAEIINLLLARQKQEEEEKVQQEAMDDLVTETKSEASSSAFSPQDDSNEPPAEFYSSLETSADQEAAYEDIASSGGAVLLEEDNITTIELPDGQILSLGEETLSQIAGLSNYPGGSIALATTQSSDGSQQIQYIIKSRRDTKDKHYVTFGDDSKQFSASTRIKNNVRPGLTYTCYVCQRQFSNQSELQRHTKTHLGQKEFVCDVPGCSKEYTTSHHLKVHQRQHSGERPFSCEWEGCGKMFTTGYGLKSHFRTHTNERPYKCQEHECSKAFKTSGDLQKHIRTHTGERPFTCPYEGCNRSFTTSNIRKVHLRTHTGEKPYKCEIETCGRTFASATNYKNHSRIHTGERPYVCEVPGCLKRFTEYSSLYKHNIVHTQQKPYTCSLCHKTYRQTSTLAMHKRAVHGTDDMIETEKQDPVRCVPKRPKISRSNRQSRQSKSLSTSSTNTGYIQGMSLVINNTGGGDQTFNTGFSTHQLTQSSEIPGAIAIPIQVTMNSDGTIAGAQGLNLTDGSGRMIPVNLSVSIPISSFTSLTGNTNTITTNSMDNVINILTQSTSDVTPRQRNTGSSTDEDGDNDDGRNHLSPRMLTNDGRLLSTADVPTQTVGSSKRTKTVANEPYTMTIESDELSNDNFETEEDDVTDKYLTSHYTKELKHNRYYLDTAG